MSNPRIRREIINNGSEESRAEKRSVSLILKDHLRVPLHVAMGKGVSSGFGDLITPLRLSTCTSAT